MHEQAKKLANWHSKCGDKLALASVYRDGVAIYLSVSRETQGQIEMALEDRRIASARSDDDYCGVVIVSLDDWQDSLDIVSMVVPLKWNDNRDEDACSIRLFTAILQVPEGPFHTQMRASDKD